MVKRDATAPAVAFAGNRGTYALDERVTISCSASDAMSGIASQNCPGVDADAYNRGWRDGDAERPRGGY